MHPAIIEIIELHAFFEDWFNGTLPKTESAFARFAKAMDKDFTIVDPGGTEATCTPLLAGLWAAHGMNPGVKIWIERAQMLHSQEGLTLARYDECQTDARGSTRRISSVWLQQDVAAPAGLRWLRVHETWCKA